MDWMKYSSFQKLLSNGMGQRLLEKSYISAGALAEADRLI